MSDLPAWLTTTTSSEDAEEAPVPDTSPVEQLLLLPTSTVGKNTTSAFLGIGNSNLLSLIANRSSSDTNSAVGGGGRLGASSVMNVPAGWASSQQQNPQQQQQQNQQERDVVSITHTRQPPPGPQHFGLVDPPRRSLYRMMIRQLISDGHSDAAMAIARSTGILVANPGSNPQQLLDLVQTGITASRFLSLGGSSKRPESYIEDVVYGSDPYSAYDLPAQNAFDFREWYTSKSFERPVRCLDFHKPSGKTVAVGTSNGDVRIYSVPLADEFSRSATVAELQTPTDAALIRSLPGLHPGHSVEAVGLHPTEPLCVSGGRDGKLVFTKYGQANIPKQTASAASSSNNSRVVSTHHDTYAVRCMDFHPSGELVLFGTDHNAPRLFHLETGSVFCPSVVSSEVSSVNYGGGHRRGRHYHHQHQQQAAHAADKNNENAALKEQDPNVVHLGSIIDVAYSVDGRHFASASFDGSVRIFDGRQGSEALCIQKAHCGVAVTSVELSKSGFMILTGGLDSQVRLWDIRKPAGGNEIAALSTTGAAPKKLSFHTRAKCCFSFDEHSIITTSSTFQGLLYIDAATMRVTSSIEYWNPESSRLRNANASGGGGGTGGGGGGGDAMKDSVLGGGLALGGSSATSDQIKNGVGSLTSGVIRAVASSPNRCLLAAGGDDMRLRLWAPVLTTMRNL